MSNRRRLARERLEYYLVYPILVYRRPILIVGLILLVCAIAIIFLNQIAGFEGLARIPEIVEGNWTYWGDVKLDVAGAKITVQGEAAWLSTTGTVTQTQAFNTAIEPHVNDMKAIFDRTDLTADQKLMETTHYGIRRMTAAGRARSKSATANG